MAEQDHLTARSLVVCSDAAVQLVSSCAPVLTWVPPGQCFILRGVLGVWPCSGSCSPPGGYQLGTRREPGPPARAQRHVLVASPFGTELRV